MSALVSPQARLSSLPNSVSNPQTERHGKGENNLRMHQLQTQIEELQDNLRDLQHQAEHWRREAEKQQTEQQRGRHKAALAFAGSPMGDGTSMGNGAQEGGTETEMQLRAQIAQLQSQLQTSTVKGSMNETMVQVSSIGGSTHTTNILDDTTPNFVNFYSPPFPLLYIPSAPLPFLSHCPLLSRLHIFLVQWIRPSDGRVLLINSRARAPTAAAS